MRKATTLLAGLVLAGAIVNAKAATVTLSYKTGFNAFVDFKLNGSSTATTSIAGPFLTSITGGGPTVPASFESYCIDLAHGVTNPDTYDVHVFMTNNASPSLPNGGGLAWLYNNYAGAVANSTQGAALQVALWKALTDGGTANSTNLAAGNFILVTSGAIASQAQTYLNAWSGKTDVATWLQAIHVPVTDNQDLIGPKVPEPPMAALMGSGVLGSLALIRRRRRK